VPNEVVKGEAEEPDPNAEAAPKSIGERAGDMLNKLFGK
jgi:hypothetical protein